ncbi:hypothetical protein SLE2022_344210 [Rubroshorea leprosula]
MDRHFISYNPPIGFGCDDPFIQRARGRISGSHGKEIRTASNSWGKEDFSGKCRGRGMWSLISPEGISPPRADVTTLFSLGSPYRI